MKRVFTLFLILALLMLSAGCTPGGPAKTATPTLGGLPVLTLTPVASLVPTPTPGVSEKRIGFVRKAYTKSGVNYVDIDYVSFLTGAEAVEKAKADGMAEQDEDGTWYVPNDYYISNDNPMLRTFPLGSTCSIKIVDLGGSGAEIPMKSLTFAQFKAKGPTFDDGEMLMYINVQNGIAVSLEEQYRP
jgi:hypothetical protein